MRGWQGVASEAPAASGGSVSDADEHSMASSGYGSECEPSSGASGQEEHHEKHVHMGPRHEGVRLPYHQYPDDGIDEDEDEEMMPAAQDVSMATGISCCVKPGRDQQEVQGGLRAAGNVGGTQWVAVVGGDLGYGAAADDAVAPDDQWFRMRQLRLKAEGEGSTG